MSKIKWVLINGLFLFGLYYAYHEKVDFAENLVLFFAWVNIVFSFFMFADPVIEIMKKKGRSVPPWINVSSDLLVTSIFIAFGAWITGSFWLIHLLVQEAAWASVKESKAADK